MIFQCTTTISTFNVFLFNQDNIICPTDFEMTVPGLSPYISAPDQRALFIPESMVVKIEQKGSNKATKKSKSKEKTDQPIQEVLNKQPIFTKEDNNSKKQKEKIPRSSSDMMDHLKEVKLVQAEPSEPKNDRGVEDGMSFVKPVRDWKDPNNYQHHQHSQCHEDRGKPPLYVEQYKHGGLYSDASNSSVQSSQSSHSSANYTSELYATPVDKKQAGPCSEYDHSLDIQVASRVKLPSTGENSAIYGIVRWIGTIPKCEEYIAGIELVSIVVLL